MRQGWTHGKLSFWNGKQIMISHATTSWNNTRPMFSGVMGHSMRADLHGRPYGTAVTGERSHDGGSASSDAAAYSKSSAASRTVRPLSQDDRDMTDTGVYS